MKFWIQCRKEKWKRRKWLHGDKHCFREDDGGNVYRFTFPGKDMSNPLFRLIGKV